MFSADRLVGEKLLLDIALCISSIKWLFQNRTMVVWQQLSYPKETAVWQQLSVWGSSVHCFISTGSRNHGVTRHSYWSTEAWSNERILFKNRCTEVADNWVLFWSSTSDLVNRAVQFLTAWMLPIACMQKCLVALALCWISSSGCTHMEDLSSAIWWFLAGTKQFEVLTCFSKAEQRL